MHLNLSFTRLILLSIFLKNEILYLKADKVRELVLKNIGINIQNLIFVRRMWKRQQFEYEKDRKWN